MGKTLIITEKPSVAREYASILHVNGKGNGVIENEEYVITWCVGHLVEMCYPESYDIKYKKWNLEDLPFLPKTYQYAVIDNVKKQYEIVHSLLHDDRITKILYAGDSGREGQVIIELIRRFGGVKEEVEERRVWIDSCTEEEIKRGIREAKPMSEYDNLANAGIMRAIEDYAMGINFSRALSVKYGKMLNKAANTNKYVAIAIGRVMTCVLGMVVRREREIRNFKETPFYRVVSTFGEDETEFQGEWKAVEGSDYFESPLLYKENGFRKKENALQLIESLKPYSQGTIASIQKTTEKKKPPLLFNLAELQAECSKRFKISPDETLKIAQELYERKLTTYPRTDARVLTTAIAKEIGKNLKGLTQYADVKPFLTYISSNGLYKGLEKTPYTDDKKVTDHYAIIPTGQVTVIDKLSSTQRKVYDLIVRRFLSIFYPPALYQKANISVKLGEEKFFTSVKVLKDPGFLQVMQSINTNEKALTNEKEDSESDDEETKEISNEDLLEMINRFKKGDSVATRGMMIKEGKTSPPKRYTSGSMVLAMENAGNLIEDEELRAQIKGAGIGTSATRAEIIDKLVRIGYLKLNKKTQILTPMEFGEMIYEVVFMTMPSMLNPEMTASWEKGLASVERGERTVDEYRDTLEKYVVKYLDNVKKEDLSVPIAEKIKPIAVGAGYENVWNHDKHDIEAKCPLCGGVIGTTSFGYGCRNYKSDGSGCGFSIGTIAKKRLSENEVIQLLSEKKIANVKGFRSKNGRLFDAGLELEIYEEGGKKKSKINFIFDKG